MTAAVAERQELEVVEPARPAPVLVHRAPEARATDLMAVIAGAVERGATREMIETLFTFHERVRDDERRRAFQSAFATAKGQFPKIIKDANVAFTAKNGGANTDYWHETIAGIAEAVDPPLSENGLAYCWDTKQLEGGRIEVTCILTHVGGWERRVTLAGSPDNSGNKNNLQAVASTVTYLERYTLKAALGIASAHDDDGQGGAYDFTPDPGRTTKKRPAEPAQPAMKITASQAADLKDRLEKAKEKGADEAQFWVFAQATKVEDVAADRLPTIISALKSRYGV